MVLFDQIRPLGTEIQTRFPDSLIVFLLAGLVEKIIVHLFLTTLLVWLVSGVILRNRYQETIFWLVAVGVGILYWLLQISAIRTYFPEKFSVVLAIQILFVIAATITVGAYYFRIGSYARNEARVDSDLDLVLLISDPQNFINEPEWIADFGPVTSYEVEDWGLVTSLRVFYEDGLEVEYGVTSSVWVNSPIDEGTRRVIADGMQILLDRDGLLSRALAEATSG